jgi:hypothetical protein
MQSGEALSVTPTPFYRYPQELPVLKTHKLEGKSLKTSEGYEALLNLYDS